MCNFACSHESLSLAHSKMIDEKSCRLISSYQQQRENCLNDKNISYMQKKKHHHQQQQQQKKMSTFENEDNHNNNSNNGDGDDNDDITTQRATVKPKIRANWIIFVAVEIVRLTMVLMMMTVAVLMTM